MLRTASRERGIVVALELPLGALVHRLQTAEERLDITLMLEGRIVCRRRPRNDWCRSWPRCRGRLRSTTGARRLPPMRRGCRLVRPRTIGAGACTQAFGAAGTSPAVVLMAGSFDVREAREVQIALAREARCVYRLRGPRLEVGGHPSSRGTVGVGAVY